jgi:hypothetical protein
LIAEKVVFQGSMEKTSFFGAKEFISSSPRQDDS